eukprot:m.938539 g.938539  ORF g.938539 m.938539 type:complete len:1577 (+) comp23819_c0_seq4:381-5111(+)
MAGSGGGVQPQSGEADGTLTKKPYLPPDRHDTQSGSLNVSAEEAAAAAALVGLFGAPAPDKDVVREHKPDLSVPSTPSVNPVKSEQLSPGSSNSCDHKKVSQSQNTIHPENQRISEKKDVAPDSNLQAKRPISPITFDLPKKPADSITSSKKSPISPIRFKHVPKISASTQKIPTATKVITRRPISPIIFDRRKDLEKENVTKSGTAGSKEDTVLTSKTSAKSTAVSSTVRETTETGRTSARANDNSTETVSSSTETTGVEKKKKISSTLCNEMPITENKKSKNPAEMPDPTSKNSKDDGSVVKVNDSTRIVTGDAPGRKTAQPKSSDSQQSSEAVSSQPRKTDVLSRSEHHGALRTIEAESTTPNGNSTPPNATSTFAGASTENSSSYAVTVTPGANSSGQQQAPSNSVKKTKGKPLPARGARTAANKKIAETSKTPTPKQPSGDASSEGDPMLSAVPAPPANARTPSKIRKTGGTKSANATSSRAKKQDKRSSSENAASAGRVKKENIQENDDDDYVTRCVCGFTHNDDFMVSCDRCEVWQHIECFQDINKDRMPEHYFCEKCKPRPFNASHARRIQMQKLAQLAKIEGGDGSDSGSDDDGDVDADNDDELSGERFLASSTFRDDARSILEGYASPRRVSIVDINTTYLEMRNIPSKRRQGVFLSSAVPPRSFLGILPGSFRRASKVPEWMSIKRKKQPFIWKHPTLDLCLDARTTDSVAKHVRRSCCPNAEFVIISCGAQRGLGLYTTQVLDQDEEIAVAYDFDFMATQYKGENACTVPGCAKREAHQRKRQRSQPQLRITIPRSANADEPAATDDGGRTLAAAHKSPAPGTSGDRDAARAPHPSNNTECHAPASDAPPLASGGNTRSTTVTTATGEAASAPSTPKPPASPLVFPSGDKPLSREERKLMAIMRQFAALEGDAAAGGSDTVAPAVAADMSTREGGGTAPAAAAPGSVGGTTPKPRGRSRSRTSSVTTNRDGKTEGQIKPTGTAPSHGASDRNTSGRDGGRSSRRGSTDERERKSEPAGSEPSSAKVTKDRPLATVSETTEADGAVPGKRTRAVASPTRTQSNKPERSRTGGAGRASRHSAGPGTTTVTTPRAPKRDDSLFATGYAGSAAYGGFQVDSGRTPARSKRAARHMDAVLARRISAAQTPPAVHVLACKEAITKLFSQNDLAVLKKWRAPKPPQALKRSSEFSDCSKKKRLLHQWASAQSKCIKTEADPSPVAVSQTTDTSCANVAVKTEVCATPKAPTDAPSTQVTPATRVRSPSGDATATTGAKGGDLDLFDEQKPSQEQLRAAVGATPQSRSDGPPPAINPHAASGAGSKPPPRPDWGWDALNRPPPVGTPGGGAGGVGTVTSAPGGPGVRVVLSGPGAQPQQRNARHVPGTPVAGSGGMSLPATPTTPGLGGSAFFSGTVPASGGGASPRLGAVTTPQTPSTGAVTKKISMSDYIKNRRKGKKASAVSKTSVDGAGSTQPNTTPVSPAVSAVTAPTKTNTTNDEQPQQPPMDIGTRTVVGEDACRRDGTGADSRKRPPSPGLDALALSDGANSKMFKESCPRTDVAKAALGAHGP